MVYTEIKLINGRKYKYERKSYRIGNIVKHASKYLGAMEPVNKKKNSNLGRKPKLKVRELNKEEGDFIGKSLRHSESFIKDRAKIISFSTKGNTVKQICEKMNFYRPKVEGIIKNFNRSGLKIFERKKRIGRPRKITKEERAKVLQFVNTNPAKLELHFNNWSHTKLSQFAKANKIQVSPSQIGRIIKQDEIKYKRKIGKLYSNDKNFLKKS